MRRVAHPIILRAFYMGSDALEISTGIRTLILQPSGQFQAGSAAGLFTTIDLFYRSEDVVVER